MARFGLSRHSYARRMEATRATSADVGEHRDADAYYDIRSKSGNANVLSKNGSAGPQRRKETNDPSSPT